MNKQKKVYKIKLMHCASCAMVIESDLEDAGFVSKCSYAKELLEIEHEGKLDENKIKQVIKNAGYDLASL